MTDGIRVAALDEIPRGEGIEVSRAITGTDDDIAILRDEDGSVWALNSTCTHDSGSLADGWVDNGEVECPLHFARFCVRTGAVLGFPATEDTVAHRVEVGGDEVYLFPGGSPESDEQGTNDNP